MKLHPMYSSIRNVSKLLLLMVVLPFSATALQAQYTLVDDFECGSTSLEMSQEGFGNGSLGVAEDPLDSGNMVLAPVVGDAAGNNLRVYGSVPAIEEGNTGTFYFRVMRAGTALNAGIGLSDVAEPSGWGDYEVTIQPASFNVRNASSYDPTGESSDSTWYEIWVVVDNAADTATYYARGGTEYPEITMIYEAAAFRNGTSDPLNMLYIHLATDGTQGDALYIDDIYVNPTAEAVYSPAGIINAYSLIDDFESGSTVLSMNQEGFGNGTMDIIADPDDETNMVLAPVIGDANGNNMRISGAIPAIEEGSTGTLYFRMKRADTNLNAGVGLSDVADPMSWGDYEVTIQPASFNVRNASAYDPSGESSDNTWYEIWVVVDNAADTATYYARGGSEYPERTVIFEDAAFRNGTNDPLHTLYIYLATDGTQSDPLYIDDIYVNPKSAALYTPTELVDAFMLVDNFNSGDTVFEMSQEGFGNGALEVVDDASIAGNPVLASVIGDANGNNMRVFGAIPAIEEGQTGTLYFRMKRAGANLNAGIGLSDVAMPMSWGDYEVTIQPASFNVRNLWEYVPTGESSDETWYEIWVVVDNGNDTATYYARGGEEYPNVTQIYEAAAFRNGTTDVLSTFFVYLNTDGTQDDALYIDDVYVNPKSEALYSPLESWSAKQTVTFETASAISIDGAKDNSYAAREVAIDRPADGTLVAPVADDLSATFTTAYDATNLYVFIDVTDDAVNIDSPDRPWQDDGVELFLDMDLNRGGVTDNVNDFKFTFHPQEDGTLLVDEGWPPNPGGTDISLISGASTISETGYTIEVAIPWEILTVMPEPGMRFGLEIDINDDDLGGDSREDILTWSAAKGGNYATDRFGIVEVWQRSHLLATMTTAEVAIDGSKDSAYTYKAELHRLANGQAQPAPEDLSSSFYVAGNDTYLNLFIEVTDEAINVDSPDTPWNDDLIELFLDMDLNRGGAFDGVNDFKYSLNPQADGTVVVSEGFPVNPAGSDISLVLSASVITETGYIIEVALPWDMLGVSPEAGLQFGLDLNVNDDDLGGKNRQHILTWSAAKGGNFATNLYGVVEIFSHPEVTANQTDAAIMIDGAMDDAYAAADVASMSRVFSGYPAPSASDLSGAFYPLVDADNLYLLIHIMDQKVNVDGPHDWKDDGLEFFLDMDLNRGGSVDNVNDFKFVFIPQEDGSLKIDEGWPPNPPGTDLSLIQGASSIVEGGYMIEVALPWSLLTVTPEDGLAFGMDIHANDDDAGGDDRQHILSWSAGRGGNQATDVFGTVVIAMEGGSSGGDTFIPATDLGEGKYESAWFGVFVPEGDWVWHDEGLGWIQPVNGADAGFWFFSVVLDGWSWTGESVYPFLYAESFGWMYLDYTVDAGAAYYVYDTGIWLLP